jgi:hypothetical protein
MFPKGGVVTLGTASPTSFPVDVFVIALRALLSAGSELENIRNVDIPAPKELEDALLNGAAAIAVVRRISESTPNKAKLIEMCHEELHREKKQPTTLRLLNGLGVPVLPEVQTTVDEALEALRRRALVDPVVRDAMEEASL